MEKVFFIDFDGTITKQDTCEMMVKAFAKGGWEEINRLWESKELSTSECANMTFKLFNADIDNIKALMDTVDIDEYFKDFISKCRDRGYKIYILSDGYDYNIEAVLKKHDIDLPFYSNRLLYEPGKGFNIECTYSNSDCDNCGTCKTALIKELRGETDTVIYIGDGYSDTCAVESADKVYAKDSLYKYCIGKEIIATEFKSFKDIINEEFLT